MKDDSIKVEPEKIFFQSIRVLKSGIGRGGNASIELSEKLRATIQALQSVNIEGNGVQIILIITIEGLNNKEELIAIEAMFEIEFIFTIDNLSSFIIEKDEEKKTVKTDANLGMILLGTSCSTARGIIHSRLLGTALDGYVLPLVNARTLLSGNSVSE